MPPPAVWHICGDHYMAGLDLFVPLTSSAHLSCGGKWRSTLEPWDTLCDVATVANRAVYKGLLVIADLCYSPSLLTVISFKEQLWARETDIPS